MPNETKKKVWYSSSFLYFYKFDQPILNFPWIKFYIEKIEFQNEDINLISFKIWTYC